MNSGKIEQFQLLLQQLQLTEDAIMPYFTNAQIEKLVVEKKARKWHFHFLFEKILPYRVFLTFTDQLEKTFSYIANISYSIRALDSQISEGLITDYWQRSIQEIEGISPPIIKLLNEQIPTVRGNKLLIKVHNEMEGMSLKRKYIGILSQVYENFGFPLLMIDTEISAEESNQQYEEFLKAKQKEDEERGKQALIDMKKKEENESADAVEHSGPLMIGLTIRDDAEFRKLEEIVDEERRIAVEGYVFFAETKELRSGRTLLTFKITDYTSSILVKMFSRDKEDAALFNLVQKGMWLKVRGSIQNDTFVRDLVMIGNDINEIKPRDSKRHCS